MVNCPHSPTNKNRETLSNIYNEGGLRSFQELKQTFNFPGTSYSFTYICALQCALMVSQSTFVYSSFMHVLSCTNVKSGFVSCLYNKLQKKSNGPFGNVTVWKFYLKDFDLSMNWQIVWPNIPLTS